MGGHGSFYGEVPLEEGPNEIEVVAVLHDDREASERFQISFRTGMPREEQIAELSKLREENRAMIDRIKEQLAAQMEQVRAERDKGARRHGRVVEMEPKEQLYRD